MEPSSLPPSYVRFITRMGGKGPYVWAGIRVSRLCTLGRRSTRARAHAALTLRAAPHLTGGLRSRLCSEHRRLLLPLLLTPRSPRSALLPRSAWHATGAGAPQRSRPARLAAALAGGNAVRAPQQPAARAPAAGGAAARRGGARRHRATGGLAGKLGWSCPSGGGAGDAVGLAGSGLAAR